MKHTPWLVVLAALSVAGGGTLAAFLVDRGLTASGVAWAGDGTSSQSAGGGLPPLKVDRTAPLLLDDTAQKPAKTDRPKADNEACYCCHRNYEGEEMVEVHAVEKIGCTQCHGESVAHRNDENHVTPPDTMYAPEQIEPVCLKCHETHDAPARKVIARWRERCPAKEKPEELVCTDCHGAHRLALRTVRWDKRTRAFIGGEPGTKAAPDVTNKKNAPPAEKQ